MRKKSGLIVLILVIVLQLCVPAGMIIYKNAEHNTIVENGELCKFKIKDMYYRKGKLDINIETYDDWAMQFADVQADSIGYAELLLTDTKPEGSIYIESSDKDEFDFPVEAIKTEEFENLEYVYFFEKTGEEDWWDELIHEMYNRAYLEAYVYEGKVSPVAVYIDGVEANVYLSRLNEDKQ
ncbi:MAG: hypothetical protein IJZ35_04775 [Clostridia bacterium]|nr:hypothetical protein [Clostridia bacterium]